MIEHLNTAMSPLTAGSCFWTGLERRCTSAVFDRTFDRSISRLNRMFLDHFYYTMGSVLCANASLVLDHFWYGA
jgi:hypothetical protein